MRTSRVFRLLFRILIILLTLSVTIVSFLGGLSAVMILTDQNNLGFDTNPDININYNLTSGVLLDANFTLPFNITNAGYFDMDNLQLQVELKMNYTRVDWNGTDTSPGVNGTYTVKIFEKTQDFGSIPKGLTGYFNISGLYADFYPLNFPNITEIDLFASPLLEFYANFTISLDYSLGMHSITINVQNIKVGELP